MNDEYKFDFPKELLSIRISVALFSLGLNEFYASFKYLHRILLHIIENQSDNTSTIKAALKIVEDENNITERTLITALGKTFGMCNKEIFTCSPLYGKIKLNYMHKTRIVKDIILKEIKKKSMT